VTFVAAKKVSQQTFFLSFFVVVVDPGSKSSIWDPRSSIRDPKSGINILDPQHWFIWLTINYTAGAHAYTVTKPQYSPFLQFRFFQQTHKAIH
jgi:hypothetical protein